MTDHEYRDALIELFHKAIFELSLEKQTRALHVRSGPLTEAAIAVAAVYSSSDTQLKNPAILKRTAKWVGQQYQRYVHISWDEGGLAKVFHKVYSYTDPDTGVKQ